LFRLHNGLFPFLLFFLGTGLFQTKPVPPTASPSPQTVAAPATQANTVSAPVMPKPEAGYHFPLNQTLVYGAQWRVFNAGTATLRMEQAGQEVRIVGAADAAGSVALLYHVRDRFESFVNPADFCSRNITKNAEEGYRKVDTTISFDYQRHKALLDQKNIKKKETKHTENDIPPCVTDVISAIFYVGSLPLQAGKTFTFPLNDGGKTVNVDLHVEAREQVKTPSGTYNAFRVRPEVPPGVLKNKGQIWVWYSDDAARIPIQMRGHMFWGTLTLTLQRIEKK
jgi:hypothetical protein